MLEYDGDYKEFEGDKNDIAALLADIEGAIDVQKSATASPIAKVNQASPVPAPVVVQTPTIQPPVVSPSPASIAKVAIALYDYTPVEEGELEIFENDILIVLDTTDSDWWMVKHLKKPGEGLVPMTYVEVNVP